MTREVLSGEIVSTTYFWLSFDIGYRRLSSRSDLSRIGLFSGLLFSGYDGRDLESYLPLSEDDLMIIQSMHNFIQPSFIKSGYSFRNGVPKNWSRLLQIEPGLRIILFTLAGIAGQADVIDQMFREDFPFESIQDGLTYFPNEILEKLDIAFRTTRPVIDLERSDCGVPRNCNAYEFLRPYLRSVNIDGLPPSLVRIFYPDMYRPSELVVFLNDQSFRPMIDLEAIAAILMINQIKPEDINIHQLWILRHEMRALLPDDPKMKRMIDKTLQLIGTSANMPHGHLAGFYIRSDLAPRGYPRQLMLSPEVVSMNITKFMEEEEVEPEEYPSLAGQDGCR